MPAATQIYSPVYTNQIGACGAGAPIPSLQKPHENCAANSPAWLSNKYRYPIFGRWVGLVWYWF